MPEQNGRKTGENEHACAGDPPKRAAGQAEFVPRLRLWRSGGLGDKLRHVLADGNGDAEQMRGAFAGIVPGQLATQTVGLDADDGVRILIEVRAALEELDADGVFLDLRRLSGKEFFAKITEQARQLGCAREVARSKHGLKLGLLRFELDRFLHGLAHVESDCNSSATKQAAAAFNGNAEREKATGNGR